MHLFEHVIMFDEIKLFCKFINEAKSQVDTRISKINFLFELSEDTKSPISVHQLLDLILSYINKETKITKLSNGDIIQALAMALAVRMKMVVADEKLVEKIVIDCVSKAINAAKSLKIENQNHQIKRLAPLS